MYENFIKQLEQYISTRELITVARHIYTFRVKNSTIEELKETFLKLDDEDKKAILERYTFLNEDNVA